MNNCLIPLLWGVLTHRFAEAFASNFDVNQFWFYLASIVIFFMYIELTDKTPNFPFRKFRP